MKPLELTIYPLDMTFPAGYRLPRCSYVTRRAADRMAEEKRLTTAELSAEYWRASEDFGTVSEGYRWDGITGKWDPSETPAQNRLNTLERFATLPHASERNYE